MAEERNPPPLDQNVDLFGDDDDDDDDMFKSAVAEPTFDDGTDQPDKLDTQLPEECSQSPPSTVLSSTEGSKTDQKSEGLKAEKESEAAAKAEDKESAGSDDGNDLFAESDLPMKKEPVEASGMDSPLTTKPKLQELDEVAEEDDKFNIEISVNNPMKVGDGMNAYMVYQVNTVTNIPAFNKSQFAVKRRFSDFLGLHEKLVAKHRSNGVIVPKPPEKSTMGMAKVKMSKEESGSQDFVEKRRAALERYMNRTAAHRTLRMDPDVRDFLTMDADLPKASGTSALSAAGVMRLFGKVGDAVTKLSSSITETDPWFEEKVQLVENLEIQIRKLHDSSEVLVVRRHTNSQNATQLAKAVAAVAECDEHTNLAQVMSKLSVVEEHLQQITEEQGDSDFFTFSELLKDYLSQLSAVKDVFAERIKIHKAWKDAEATLSKKREAKVKLELANKRDKLPQAQKECEEYESTVEKGEAAFNKISDALKKEMANFDKRRYRDFKANLVNYLQRLLNNETQVIQHWEKFLPEARSIS